jgi:hypothetical protein
MKGRIGEKRRRSRGLNAAPLVGASAAVIDSALGDATDVFALVAAGSGAALEQPESAMKATAVA